MNEKPQIKIAFSYWFFIIAGYIYSSSNLSISSCLAFLFLLLGLERLIVIDGRDLYNEKIKGYFFSPIIKIGCFSSFYVSSGDLFAQILALFSVLVMIFLVIYDLLVSNGYEVDFLDKYLLEEDKDVHN